MAKSNSSADLLKNLGGNSAPAETPAPPAPEATPATPEPALTDAAGSPGSEAAGNVSPPDSTPTAPPPATPTTAPEAAPNPFLAKLQELGFQGVSDEQQARDRLLEAYAERERQLQQLQTEQEQMRNWALYGQQFYQQLQDPAVQQFFAQRQPGSASQPEQPAERKWYQPPPYNPNLVARWRESKLDPATNQVVTAWKPDTPPAIREQYEARETFAQEVSERLVSDPAGAIGDIAKDVVIPAVRELVEQMITERVMAPQQEARATEFTQRIGQEHGDWLYKRDPISGRMTDDLTPDGIRAVQWVQEAAQMGIASPEHRWEYALLKRQAASGLGHAPAQQAAPPAGPAATPADRTREYLQRAAAQQAPTQNRAGAVADPAGGQRPNRRRSSGHDLVANLQIAGASVG